MVKHFSLPPGTIGRFGVVRLWPGVTNAEVECIARLKIAAEMLDLECIEVDADGGLAGSPGTKITKQSVDFVIHLHFDTPKNYDAFSFAALWNPLAFYHQWGYQRCSRNLTTHDDFLSCSSDAADDHVARMIRKSAPHLPARFRLYHSTPDILHPPTLGEGKLFYAGINWERLGGGKSRHGDVLKLLDRTGKLKIFGPTVFQGVRVWDGYQSYVRELPFDGISLPREISTAGVALVLSSQAHKDSHLMSSRLFESVAAGALVICDENEFAKKFFGDSLLYIDCRLPANQIVADIERHLEFARQQPGQALQKCARAQQIFRDRFTLIRNLSEIYSGLQARKKELAERQNPPGAGKISVRLFLLMPAYSVATLKAHLASVAAQDYAAFSPVLVVSHNATAGEIREIEKAISISPKKIEILKANFVRDELHPDISAKVRMGEVVNGLLSNLQGSDAITIVAPNETLQSNHISVLAGALQRDLAINCAATAALLKDGDNQIKEAFDKIDFATCDKEFPTGYGRFIFRANCIPPDVSIALRYIDSRPLAVLVGDNKVAQQLASTVIIDVRNDFFPKTWNEPAENAILQDFCPVALELNNPPPHLEAAAQSTQAVTGWEVLRIMRNPGWLKHQVQRLRKQGLHSRLRQIRRRLVRPL